MTAAWKRALGCHRSKSGDGFTLIELLAVMAIMMILMGIGVVSYLGLSRAVALDAATDHLRSTIMLARQNAMVNARRTYVILKPDNYVMVQMAGTGRGLGSTLMDDYGDFSSVRRGWIAYNLETGGSSLVNGATNDPPTFWTADNLWTGKCRYGWVVQPRVNMPKRVRLGQRWTTNPVSEFIVLQPDGTTRVGGYEFTIFDENLVRGGDPYRVFKIGGLTGFITIEEDEW